jgi:hypothetical protein
MPQGLEQVPSTIGDWTPQVRQIEMDLLGQAQRFDSAAIAELEAALAGEQA